MPWSPPIIVTPWATSPFILFIQNIVFLSVDMLSAQFPCGADWSSTPGLLRE